MLLFLTPPGGLLRPPGSNFYIRSLYIFYHLVFFVVNVSFKSIHMTSIQYHISSSCQSLCCCSLQGLYIFFFTLILGFLWEFFIVCCEGCQTYWHKYVIVTVGYIKTYWLIDWFSEYERGDRPTPLTCLSKPVKLLICIGGVYLGMNV